MNNISFVLFPQASESSMNFNISKMVCTPLAPIKHIICPAKFYITFVFHFSWVLQPSEEKLKTTLMQNQGGGGQIRCIMGDVQVAYSVIPFNSHKQFILSIQIEIVTIHHQFLVAQGVIRYNSLYREAPPERGTSKSREFTS